MLHSSGWLHRRSSPAEAGWSAGIASPKHNGLIVLTLNKSGIIFAVKISTLIQFLMKKFASTLIIILILVGCSPVDHPDYSFEYETIIADTPTNLEKLNTTNDDYNSNLPYPAARSEIYFSSNRNSGGDNYDIICKAIDISYHERDNILNFSIPTNDTYSSFQTKLLPFINSQNDELGPFSFFGTNGWDYFFYSNNESGDFNIKFVYTRRLDWGTWDGQGSLLLKNATVVNSDSDDLYPTITPDKSKLLFCSNRENDLFDIYSLDLNSDVLLHDDLTSTKSVEIRKESVLSGTSNDKCPSVTGNLIVFTSDRDGGYGGYDLYYSQFMNNQWSTPVNFGDKINSSSDEYRPITFTFNGIDLMIFSSNRSGGKGGFDLYCVKIGELLKK